jgi:hypothetical protein
MSEIDNVNSQILGSIEAVNQATMSPLPARESGLDKATQAVAQSAAMAIQDATDNLRNSMTIATTAIGVAMSQFIATGDHGYKHVIDSAQDVIDKAAKQFKHIGTDSAEVLQGFQLKPDQSSSRHET